MNSSNDHPNRAPGRTDNVITDRDCSIFMMTVTVWAIIAVPLGILNYWSGWKNVPQGPATAIYEFSRGLAETGRITSEYAELIRRQVVAASVGTSMWQDVFSLSKSGDTLPKHAPGLILLLAPVIVLFGELGPLIWQSLVTWLILFAAVHLAERSSGGKADFGSVVVLAFGTQ